MSKFLCKFRINEIARVEGWEEHPDKSGADRWQPTEMARVKMTPVPGEPFGRATPSGTLEMVIHNKAVVDLINKAGVGVEYYVAVQLASEVDASAPLEAH